MKNKKCSSCKEVKRVEMFTKNKNTKDGYNVYCSDCSRNKNKESYKKNKKSYIDRQREYQRKRRQEDPLYVMKHRLRSRLSEVMRLNGYTKKSSLSEYLGCDWNTFKLHIESKFKDGMSWENRSEWHIDHIKPISLAKNKEEIKALSHYTNLQPLWAEDNLKKGDKWK